MKLSAVKKRILCAAVGVSMLLYLCPAALAAGMGTLTSSYSLEIARSATLNTASAVSDDGAAQNAVWFEYEPGTACRPVGVFGGKLYGRSNINAAAIHLASQGYTVFAGINADFFAPSTGLPLGPVIIDGVFMSSDTGRSAVGFFDDGSAVIGYPAYSMTLAGAGYSIKIDNFNKLRTKWGTYLLTEDFSNGSRVSTPGRDVLLRVVGDNARLRAGQPLRLVVEDIMTSDFSVAVPEGCMLLTVDDEGPVSLLDPVRIGDELTLSVYSSDPRWNDVQNCVGGGDILVSNGSIPDSLVSGSDLGSSAASVRAPRSAVGVRADGTVILFTCDGRQSGYAAGLTLRELAEQLLSMGAVSAVNLDGGGSTCAIARYPGDLNLNVVNRPSDGSLRSCANFIMLATDAQAGPASRLFVSPDSPVVLAGSHADFSVKAADVNYIPIAAANAGLSFAARRGYFDGSRYFAPDKAGSDAVTVSSGGASFSTEVNVTDVVDSIALTRQGSSAVITGNIAVRSGEKINLVPAASLGGKKVYCTPSDFTWAVSGDGATVDASGVITGTSATGTRTFLTVTGGGMSAEFTIVNGYAPRRLDDFEGSNPVAAAQEGQIWSAFLTRSADNVAYGSAALKINYDASAADGEPIFVPYASPISLQNISSPTHISLWVMGDGNVSLLSLRFNTGGGAYIDAPLSSAVDFTGYRRLSCAIPSGAVSLAGYVISPEGPVSGSVVLDQLTAGYGAPPADETPPRVDIISPSSGASVSAGGSVTAGLMDDTGAALASSVVSLTLDGRPVNFTYDRDTLRLSASLPEASAGLHRLTVEGQDACGNIARSSVDIFYEGTDISTVFTDMPGHWAEQYVGVIASLGIVNGRPGAGGTFYFDPEATMTRAELCAVVVRRLGADLSASDGVSLPYSDLSSIPEWSLPYVKAAWSLGLTAGFEGDGGKFNAGASVTRGEIMAIVGRTLKKGYDSGPLVFSDAGSLPDSVLPYAKALVACGVINGYEDNTLRPANTVRRSEVAKILYCIQ